MKKSIVTEVELQPEYLISNTTQELTYADNFRLVSENIKYTPEPKDLMIAFFKSFPKSFTVLLHTREFIAKQLRLKTAPKLDENKRKELLHQFKGEIGEQVAIFKVLDKNENELLTGQKDSHLDFQLSFLVFENENDIRMELATTVIINNSIGRIYFAIIKPIHKFYLKVILRRMERVLIDKNW